ncbi:MAG: hypothetical protein ICV69_08475 [Thermoleophilaceae bacterium]|nr:hypothetical protein [Thermoleophilaceae bacterium]
MCAVNDGSLAEAVAAIRLSIPLSLLDRPGELRLLEVARRLPPVLARRPVGLELRLAGPARADLFVGVRPRAPDGRAVLAWARRANAPLLVSALEEWRSGIGWLAWNAEYLLLEFDAATDPHAPPCVYLAPKRAANDVPVEVSDNAFHTDPEGLVRALARLSGTPPDTTAAAELDRMLAALPLFAEIFAAGAMLSRASVGSPRIAVRRLRPEGIGTLLTALDRRRTAEVLVPLAQELGDLGARFILDLDIGPAGTGCVGLEVHAGRYWTEGSADGWAPVLDVLAQRGLAERGRASAAATLPMPRRPRRPAVGISHVKVAADAARRLPAKLYLGVDGAHEALAAHAGADRPHGAVGAQAEGAR